MNIFGTPPRGFDFALKNAAILRKQPTATKILLVFSAESPMILVTDYTHLR